MRTSQVHSLHLVQTTGKGYKTGIMDAGTILANPKIIHLEGFISQSNVITVMVCSRQKEPCCPPCNIPSRSLHSNYQRTVADLPWHGITVTFTTPFLTFPFAKCYKNVTMNREASPAPPLLTYQLERRHHYNNRDALFVRFHRIFFTKITEWQAVAIVKSIIPQWNLRSGSKYLYKRAAHIFIKSREF
jgi:hypothetical protein